MTADPRERARISKQIFATRRQAQLEWHQQLWLHAAQGVGFAWNGVSTVPPIFSVDLAQCALCMSKGRCTGPSGVLADLLHALINVSGEPEFLRDVVNQVHAHAELQPAGLFEGIV